MTDQTRNPYKERKQVELSKDDLEWFEKSHGGAKLSWIINLLFHAYREKCETHPDLPVPSAAEAAKDIREEIENGHHQE